jgi:hypothetical protein
VSKTKHELYYCESIYNSKFICIIYGSFSTRSFCRLDQTFSFEVRHKPETDVFTTVSSGSNVDVLGFRVVLPESNA